MEHRSSQRKKLDIAVTIHLDLGSIRCRTKDVNAHGVFIRMEGSGIKLHTPIRVSLGTAHQTRTYRAIAVRQAPDGIGLMFTD